MWKSGFAVSICLALTFARMADAQPAQRIVSSSRTPVLRGEVDSAQVGSANRGFARPQMDVLRCQAGQVWVALKYRRGSAIDGLQIGCALPTCTGSGPCRWSNAAWGLTAGRFTGGGNVDIQQSCPADMAVSGFRAIANGAYAYDLQIECAQMGSRPPSSFVIGYTDMPLAIGAQRIFANRIDAYTGRNLGSIGSQVTASCPDAASTALSYAMGNYSAMRIPVVQTISIYCLGSSASPTTDPELKAIIDELRRELNFADSNCIIAGDHFLHGYGDAMLGTLEFLAQQRGDFSNFGKPAQDLLNLFANPDALTNGIVTSAINAADQFVRDPAAFFGGAAASYTPNAALSLAKTSGRNMIQFLKNARQPTAGSFGKPIVGNERLSGYVCTPFNPTGCQTNCWLVVHAFDQSLALKTAIHAPAAPILPTTRLYDFLRLTYGKRRLDPMHGPFGQFSQMIGRPVPTTEAQLRAALNLMGDDARGFLFLDPRTGGTGHIINVFKKNGQIYLYDAQNRLPQYFTMFGSSFTLRFFRTN